MNKKFKRIAASVMAVMTLAVGMTGMSASAANTGNTYFSSFTIPPSASGTYNKLSENKNGVRYKENSSSVYLAITTSSTNVSVQTWGLSGATWSASKQKNCTLNSSGNATNSVCVSPNYRYQIYNQIKKVDNKTYDYGYAGLKFCSASQYNSTKISGKWSPDYASSSGVRVAG